MSSLPHSLQQFGRSHHRDNYQLLLPNTHTKKKKLSQRNKNKLD